MNLYRLPYSKNNTKYALRLAIYFFAFSLLMSACTGTKKLSDKQYLLTKNRLILRDKSQIEHYNKVRDQLNDEIKSKPNGKFLWMRPKLSIYNAFTEPKKEKGIKHWLKYKVGRKPVLLDEALCENLALTFENRLYHLGHFNAKADFYIEKKKNTAEVIFDINARRVFKIDTLILPDPIDSISMCIHEMQSNSLIKKYSTYTLDLLKNERERIEDGLKNRGYFYFDQDYLLFLADTVSEDHLVKLKLIYKNDMPFEAEKAYSIDKIYISEDFKLEEHLADTTQSGDYSIISSTNFMKPKIFLNSILMEKGELYSKTKHNNSLRQLMGLRSYKFVNARYSQSESNKEKLDVSYQLTPSQKMSLSAEVNAVSKSNNFVGPGVILSFKSRNFMRGAELFSLNLRGRFEKQVSGDKQGDTAYEISADAALDLPRILPFNLRKQNKPFLPNSRITAGTGIYARVSLYRFNTFTTGLEYTWRKNDFLTHVLKPIDISFTDLVDTSDEFEEFLLNNPSIRASFEEQFIIGFSYNFIINKLGEINRRQYYLNAGIDPSGNLLAFLNKLKTSSDDPDQKLTIFGTPISQYFRIRTDFRYYFKTGKESRVDSRLYAGVGVPFGNSSVMPYVKQFYAGGTNSLRAFRARSVGPGYYTPTIDSANVLVDQTGEIKLEGNVEYRFPMVGVLKGAFFTDIGNVWLVNEDPLRPGGKFELERFYKEFAVGIGFGLRVDMDIVVVRLDWAVPARKPWKPENDRWVLDEIDLFSSSWRKNNLIWNFSIGYPF